MVGAEGVQGAGGADDQRVVLARRAAGRRGRQVDHGGSGIVVGAIGAELAAGVLAEADQLAG
jgi:hypothetical protein